MGGGEGGLGSLCVSAERLLMGVCFLFGLCTCAVTVGGVGGGDTFSWALHKGIMGLLEHQRSPEDI